MRVRFYNIISKLVSVLFLFIVIVSIGSPLYYWFWYSSSVYESVRNLVKLTTIVEFLFAILILTGLWGNKCFYKIVAIIIYFILIRLFYSIPEMQKVVDIDNCLDINYCKEGVLRSVSYGDCVKSNGAWNIDDKACDYSFDLKTCKPRFKGNWELPEACVKE